MNERIIKDFLKRVQDELENNILPFWLEHSIDHENGGFVGELSDDLKIIPDAHKGLILNSRLLWTFSAAARFTSSKRCFEVADYAYQTLRNDFWDRRYGGGFWALDKKRSPINKLKKTYAQSFFIYGLVEYYFSTKQIEALNLAKELFSLLENQAYDTQHKGYFEVFEEDWQLSANQQLSEGDMNVPKSMNTHLHLLEAYTHLYSAWKDSMLAERLTCLVNIFQNKIINVNTGHFQLFFNAAWHSQSKQISFGHDIEGSWLLCRAAEVLGDETVRESVAQSALQIAQAVSREGIGQKGGLIYESNGDGDLNMETHFWCQAEAVVGFLNAFHLSGQDDFLETAWEIWQFIENYQSDKKYGEWFWKLDRNHNPDRSMPKISEWKCPYHNSRACIETIQRLNQILCNNVQRRTILAYEPQRKTVHDLITSRKVPAINKQS